MPPSATAETTLKTPPRPAPPQGDDDPKARFHAVFSDLVDLLMADITRQFDLPADAQAYLRKVLVYNVPHGKLNRGLAVFQCYKAFVASDEVSSDDEHRANILGWCVELLQAFFLVADDIMDDSHTRRGQACFFRLPEIGLNAINDSLILESMIYRVLHLKFRSLPCYSQLVDLFRDIAYTTEMGQLLDLTTQKPSVVDLSRFTDERLKSIYKYKTSHYTFYLPVALGMVLAGVEDQRSFDTAKSVCLKMGHYFQAQDDFLDAFGDPEVTGKVGTDIEDNTCTWLIVEAMKRVNDEQRAELQANYGRKEKHYSDAVKGVYRELELPKLFAQFEQDSYDSLRADIDGTDHMPTGAFEFLLSKIYKREK